MKYSYEEATSRSFPLISEVQQEKIRHTRIAIAGTGTVGGNAALALARTGFTRFTLADPDTFDISNLNRQPNFLTDCGLPKTTVVKSSICNIHPEAYVATFSALEKTPIAAFLENAAIVICALDDPKMIFYLNEACCERKIPCLLGTDVAFASILDIFDYRHERRPLRGRINSRDLAQYENKELIKRIVIPRRLPLEMLEVIPDLVSGKLSYFPQNVISASLTTAMLTDACVQLTLGNRVAKSAYVDARGLLRPRRTKILKHLFRLAKMLKIALSRF